MREGDRPDFETLSAYVDGELPADEAASVAHRLARDPALAQAVAKLHRLKASIAETVPDLVYAPIVAKPLAKTRRRILCAVAASAALGIVAAGASVWLTSARFDPATALQAELPDPLVARHDAWLASSNGWMANRGELDRAAPTLAAAGLVGVMSANSTAPDGGTVRHDAYVGKNGCRVSLFSIVGGKTAVLPKEEPGLLRASWRSDEARFVLIARHMDEARFAVIADALRSIGSDALPKPYLLARLADARSPCLA